MRPSFLANFLQIHNGAIREWVTRMDRALATATLVRKSPIWLGSDLLRETHRGTRGSGCFNPTGD